MQIWWNHLEQWRRLAVHSCKVEPHASSLFWKLLVEWVVDQFNIFASLFRVHIDCHVVLPGMIYLVHLSPIWVSHESLFNLKSTQKKCWWNRGGYERLLIKFVPWGRWIWADVEDLPLVKVHPSLALFSRSLRKSTRHHDLVISVRKPSFTFDIMSIVT